VKEIQLSRGYVALVDDADYEQLAADSWYAAVPRPGAVYAARNLYLGGRRQKQILMHRVLLSMQSGRVDHINGDGLDNRRANLRPASVSQNGANRRAQASKHSIYKGVTDGRGGRWRALIGAAGIQRYLGTFPTEVAAAEAYDAAARELHGSFAALNFPRPGEQSAHRRAA
jgi:hypothetical protein